MNFAEVIDDAAGVFTSVDFAAGAGITAGAGVTAGDGAAEGSGVAADVFGDMPSAAAPPIIRAVTAVVIMNFFSI
jgi:hypothetical protein